jgi:sec-independent protein translocase protein TatC
VSILARRKKSSFQRAADGSMTLMEHLRELRSRLFKACLAILLGLMVGLWFAEPVHEFLNQPYYDTFPDGERPSFSAGNPATIFLLRLRIGLYIGLAIAAPFWLYQLWAFIAPGLHRHERKYSYAFAAIAAPLFFGGLILGHFVVGKSMEFLLELGEGYQVINDANGYFDFVTGVMLLFAIGFEFPLIMLMLNFTGLISARRMLGWWRIAVFLTFLFGAIVTPTPDPFGMSALAVAMSILYFAAVGVAFLNDKRKGRDKPLYTGIGDDEVSPLENEPDPVSVSGPVETSGPVEMSGPVDTSGPVAAPLPLEQRYDDVT